MCDVVLFPVRVKLARVPFVRVQKGSNVMKREKVRPSIGISRRSN